MTYKQRHGQGVEYKDEQKLEEMRCVVGEAGHPIRATVVE